MSKKTYYARSNISLDGEEYAIGAEVPLTEKQAEQIADAVTTKHVKADNKADTEPNKTDTRLTQDQVVMAIGQLDAQDPSHWTKSGKPQVDALEAVLGRAVSGTIRDAAWDAYQATDKQGD